MLSAAVIGALAGLAAFITLGFPHVLSPHYVGWLLHNSILMPYYDPSQQYVGWFFFRTVPWSLPPGKDIAFGMEFGSSIVYSDSTPLLAILLKPFSPWLAHDFQYHGIWILLCYTLQGTFGGLLGFRITGRRIPSALVAVFFAFSPLMIERSWTAYQHLPHWLILWSLLLYLTDRPPGARWVWVAVTCLSVSCSLYFLPMTAGVWLADLVRRFLARRLPVLKLLLEFVSVSAAVFFTMWFVGYFMIPTSGGETKDFGKFAINLLAPIDSWASSWLLMAQPKSPMNVGEGYAYFGLGMIVLALMAAQDLLRNGISGDSLRRATPLIAVAAGLTAFALSNHIALGNRVWNAPNYWGKLGEIFRGSARLFWPAYYATWLAIFWLVTRHLVGVRGTILLALALALQLGEQWRIYTGMREHYSQPQPWTTPLTSPFWATAAHRYRQVLVLPPGYSYPYVPISLWAADHAMSLDGVYLARIPDPNAIYAIDVPRMDAMYNGHPDPRSLYIIPDPNMYRDMVSHATSEHGVGQVDGYSIIAPYWFDGGPAGPSPLSPGRAPHD